jgi:hypothetical protein
MMLDLQSSLICDRVRPALRGDPRDNISAAVKAGFMLPAHRPTQRLAVLKEHTGTLRGIVDQVQSY